MGGTESLLNVARARFELDTAEETASEIREFRRSFCIVPYGVHGQSSGPTLRHTVELARGLFRPLRSEVPVRRRVRAHQSEDPPHGRDFFGGFGRAPLWKRLPVPHDDAPISIWPVTAAAMSAERRSLIRMMARSVVARA